MLSQQALLGTTSSLLMDRHKPPTAPPTKISPLNTSLSLAEVLHTLQIWKEEDKAEQMKLEKELFIDISAARAEHSQLLNLQTHKLQEENAQLKRQVQELTSRVTVL